MLSITWRDKKRASWIREHMKVEDILMTIKSKKWTWAGHVVRRHDNRWTTRVTEWQPRNGRSSQGRQRVRQKDGIRAFAGLSWNSLTSDKEVENVGKGHCPAMNYQWLNMMMMMWG